MTARRNALHDFRETVDILDQSNQLIRIRREVDPRFELGAVIAAAEGQGKACLFEKVKDSELPVVGGVLSSFQKIGLALGRQNSGFDSFDHADMFVAAGQSPIPPEWVETGPVKDVILTGDDVDCTSLPVPTFFALDSGPFITGAVGISRDSETGVLNVGVYRTLILGPDRIVINASTMSDLRKIYDQAAARGEAMPIVLAIGADPALLMSGVSKVRPGQSEIDVAGALQGRPVQLTKAETSDLPVPANAEIVIEAQVIPGETFENTLGEYAGQYGPETAPISKVTAITRRKDAIYHAIMAGANREHNTLGEISVYQMRQMLIDELRKKFPSIKDLTVVVKPRLTGTMMQLFISINKSNDAEPRELIREAFEMSAGFLPVSRIIKRIVVVDEDVDIHDYGDVEWAIWSRVADPEKIIIIPDAVSWELDRAAKEGGQSVRVGFDATMDLDDVDKLVRPAIPGFENVRLEDYL